MAHYDDSSIAAHLHCACMRFNLWLDAVAAKNVRATRKSSDRNDGGSIAQPTVPQSGSSDEDEQPLLLRSKSRVGQQQKVRDATGTPQPTRDASATSSKANATTSIAARSRSQTPAGPPSGNETPIALKQSQRLDEAGSASQNSRDLCALSIQDDGSDEDRPLMLLPRSVTRSRDGPSQPACKSHSGNASASQPGTSTHAKELGCSTTSAIVAQPSGGQNADLTPPAIGPESCTTVGQKKLESKVPSAGDWQGGNDESICCLEQPNGTSHQEIERAQQQTATWEAWIPSQAHPWSQLNSGQIIPDSEAVDFLVADEFMRTQKESSSNLPGPPGKSETGAALNGQAVELAKDASNDTELPPSQVELNDSKRLPDPPGNIIPDSDEDASG